MEIVDHIFYFILFDFERLLLLLLLLFVLLNACKDIGLAVNTGKTKYMEIGCHQGMMANAHNK